MTSPPRKSLSAGARAALAAGALLAVIAATPRPAQAYLDPGTGSYFLQGLVAGLLGAGFALKTFWRRIVAFLSRRSRQGGDGRDAP